MSRTFFDNRRRVPSKRKHDYRDTDPDSYLILTEGTQTEPGYFNGLKKYIDDMVNRGQLAIRPVIDCKGEGRGTSRLLQIAERYVDRGRRNYQHVWLVFDRDNFTDFDVAIECAKEKGYGVAWSNACFEVWLCLHRQYYETEAVPDEWSIRLRNAMRSELSAKNAQKTDEAQNLFPLLSADGGLQKAVKNARKLDETYEDYVRPSQRNPCTKVYELILELKPYLKELLPEE